MRVLLFGTLLAAASCGDERELREWRPEDHERADREATGQVEAGGEDMSVQILYARLCISCHGRDGRGSSMPGIRAPDLTQSRKTADEMMEVILRGRGRMPSFADQIEERDARDLVTLIRSF